MKKRCIIIVALIITFAIFGTATTSAAEIVWDEVGSISFDTMKVGASSTKEGSYINTSSSLFSKIGLKGTGNVSILSEDGDTFARATTIDSAKFVALCGVPQKALPASTYKITVTYRLSEGITFTDATRGFVARIWDGNSAHTHDQQLVTKTADLTDYTEWRTDTVEIKTSVSCNAMWFFVYAESGGYFDVKDIRLEVIGTPEFVKTVNYDASKNEDLVIDCDLKGNEIDYVDDWSNEANVKELAKENYLVAEDGRSITVKKEFMQTLKSGEKSLVFKINGVEHIVIVWVYNSTVADQPVKGGPVNSIQTTENGNGYGMALAVGGVVFASVLIAAVAAMRKKRN